MVRRFEPMDEGAPSCRKVHSQNSRLRCVRKATAASQLTRPSLSAGPKTVHRSRRRRSGVAGEPRTEMGGNNQTLPGDGGLDV